MSYYAIKDFTRRTAMVLSVLVVIVWVAMCSGCATTQVRDFCLVSKPITVACGVDASGKKTCRKYIDDQHDFLTQATEAEILAHDQKRDELCK